MRKKREKMSLWNTEKGGRNRNSGREGKGDWEAEWEAVEERKKVRGRGCRTGQAERERHTSREGRMGIKREAACLSAGPAGTDSINSSEGLALRSHSAMVPHSDHLHLWHQHTAFSYIHPTIEHTGHGGRWGMVRQQRRQFMWKTASSGGWIVVLLRKIDITGQL